MVLAGGGLLVVPGTLEHGGDRLVHGLVGFPKSHSTMMARECDALAGPEAAISSVLTGWVSRRVFASDALPAQSALLGAVKARVAGTVRPWRLG